MPQKSKFLQKFDFYLRSISCLCTSYEIHRQYLNNISYLAATYDTPSKRYALLIIKQEIQENNYQINKS